MAVAGGNTGNAGDTTTPIVSTTPTSSSSSGPSTPSTIPTTPLPQILITAADIEQAVQSNDGAERLASLLNQVITNQNQAINSLIGSAGPIPINNHLDMQGNRVTNLSATPASPTDAVSKAHADASYSAPVLAPQLEANGAAPLQSYRVLNNDFQQESSSTWLNKLASTAPSGNSSSVSYGASSGGYTPITVSAGFFTRADGSVVPYPAYNDSLAVPTSFTINTISRSGGVVTGNTTTANTLQAGDTIVITGVGDGSYDGQFVLSFVGTGGSPPGPVFQFSQAGANSSSSGGTISLFGIYYYCIDPVLLKIFRIGPYSVDNLANRINAQQDGGTLIAVAAVTASGGDTVNSAGGGTSPQQNIGGANRIIYT